MPRSVEEIAAEIDAQNEERKKNLIPSVKLDWEIQAERVAALEAQVEHWFSRYQIASGQVTEYRKTIIRALEVEPNTSVAGLLMREILKEALGCL